MKECKSLNLFTIGELLAVMSSSCIFVLEKHNGVYTWREWCSESWFKNVFDILEEKRLEKLFRVSPKVFFISEQYIFNYWILGGIQFYESYKPEVRNIEE